MRLKYIGDQVLRKATEAVTEFDENLAKTIEKMIATMHYEDGIGLAAPQVGISKKFLVIDTSPVEENEKPRAFINPEIKYADGESVMEEGCLSIPDVREDVTRPEKITLFYQDEQGQEKTEDFDDWKARVLQHEIDHLSGILFVDHISPLKRQVLHNKGVIPERY